MQHGAHPFLLAQTLKKNGVERYAPKDGDAFDADLHNAMFDVPAPPAELGGEGTVPGRVAMVIKVRLCCFTTYSQPAKVYLQKGHFVGESVHPPVSPCCCIYLGNHVVAQS